MELGKIKDLLTKCNVSQEFSNQLIESLEAYRKTVKESYDAEYNKKLEKVKLVCESEVALYKKELANKVQTFCEAKVSQIENVVAKQAQNRETEASGKLTRIKSMLEGVDLQNGKQVGELKAQNAKLQQISSQLQEDNKKLARQAARQTEISGKILKRSQLVESKNAELAKMIQTSKSGNRATITEGKVAPKATKLPTRQQPAARPENRSPAPVAANQHPTPDQIADMI